MRTAKEFAEWLLVDENEKTAGFLVAMQWVYERLELGSMVCDNTGPWKNVDIRTK